ncbi:hypothetical protein ACHAXA_000037 [Cyclostephanos tholiformis]|uniref:Sulfotransferase domain-containing protein n=1 Tax=Cyclostephanos tholiformis TaxID=382380 RepID=A0ABD3SR91_9STRA
MSSMSSSFDPGSYAYLIVHYHKTGHHLSRQLRDFLVAGTGNDVPPTSDGRDNAFRMRSHEPNTGCPRALFLHPGVVSVQAAPDFFCDPSVLADYLLRNKGDGRDDDYDREGANVGKKRGVKVIHLVRNPFSLAISNWIYHAQYPTPESWVKHVDPCTEEYWSDGDDVGPRTSYRDLIRPTLLSGNHPIMRHDDFDALRDVCKSLYRTSAESKVSGREWSYYAHLRHLDPESALMMATTHMMGQGVTGGDILRMASNIVKLRQVTILEDRARLSRHVLSPLEDRTDRTIQVMTLSMEEFTRDPYVTTMRFLDFALGDSSSRETKERIASEYESSYRDKVNGGDEHMTNDRWITNGKEHVGEDMNIAERKEGLKRFLREDELFGRVLGNIERLIEDALVESGGSGTLH